MSGTKSIFTSVTIIGILVSAIGKALSLWFGYELDAQAQNELAALISLGGSFIGDAIAFYGRLKASKRIGKPNPNSLSLFILGMACVICLAGCASVGSNDCLRRTAAVEISITEGYVSAAKLLGSGVIDQKTALKAVKVLDSADAVTAQAEQLCTIDQPSASDYLVRAGQLLLQFNTIIGE